MNPRLMVWPAAALFASQFIHGAIPSGKDDAEGGSIVGLVGGAILLVASLVGLIGALRGKEWAIPLTAWTGLVVAVGFVLYHALPFKSPLTNPYAGAEGVTPAAWIGVAVCIAAGAWAAWLGLLRDRAGKADLTGTPA